MLASIRHQAEKSAVPSAPCAAPLQRFLLTLLLLGTIAGSASAGPFTQLVVFGDSLSDVGNIAQATFGIYPGPYYQSNRFSNGPVFIEAVATGLGLPPLVPSSSGGNNFAYGGARTTGTGGLEGLFIRDIDEQVDDFVATRTADPNALFLVFAGSNDLVGGQTNMNVPIGSLADDIGRLIAHGARNFLVPNLPLLGHTPRYNGSPTTLATYNTRSQQFNAALSTMLDGLELSQPQVALYRFDTAALFAQALGDPASFGFTNTTQSAAPGLQPGTSSYDANQIADNPNEYVFWDDLHPTTAVHSVLAQRVLQLFALPGDYNHDNVVDAADYIVWRKEIGTQAEYDAWRAHFGETSSHRAANRALAHSDVFKPVPEPASLLLAAWGIVAGARCFSARHLVFQSPRRQQ